MATRPKSVPVRTIGATSPETRKLQEAVRESIRPLQKEKREGFYNHRHPDETSAAAVTPEEILWSFSDVERLTNLRIRASAAVAANGTDFATLIFYRRADGAHSEQVEIARLSTSSLALKQFTEQSLALRDTTGGNISYEVTKTGLGVQLPSLRITATTDIPAGT